MTPKAIFIATPFVVSLALAQSYLWVPSYDEQATGNPHRLEKFIQPSGGDARILNPALHADTSSARIVDLVFDGLLELDENLALRPHLAREWRIWERAYVAADPSVRLPDGAPATAEALRDRIRALVESGADPTLAADVRAVRIVPAARDVVPVPGEDDAVREIAVRVPARVEIELARVDQDLFSRLEPVLGAGYARAFDHAALAEGGADARTGAAIAAALPALAHNPVIDFELRRGVRFHDGHELDSGDVRFTWEAIVDPRNLSPRTSDFEPVKAVETPGPHAVRVVYRRLFSPAINAWTMGILPEHLLGREALEAEARTRGLGPEEAAAFGMRDSRLGRAPVGSGPFRFVEWQSDELIHLRRFEAYWDGPPLFRDFYFRIIPEPLTREIEFRTGAADTYSPQPHQVARYREDESYRAFSTLALGYTYIGYNMRRAPFDDPRVRRALGMAIDVDEIIRHVLYGEGERITGPYPKRTEWYDEGVEPLPFDPDAALALLESAGWRRGADGWLEKDGERLEFNLITNNGNPIRRQVLSIAQNAWRRIGVKCNTQLFEWAVFLQDFINPGEFDAVILGWSMGVDPDLYQIWHSSESGPHKLNFVAYESEEADRAIERLRREYDRAAQVELAHALHRTIARDQPYTFLFAPRSTQVIDRKIVMVEPDGGYAKVRASAAGDLFYHMNRWKKLAHDPGF